LSGAAFVRSLLMTAKITTLVKPEITNPKGRPAAKLGQ
jgi:hypothetical protein